MGQNQLAKSTWLAGSDASVPMCKSFFLSHLLLQLSEALSHVVLQVLK